MDINLKRLRDGWPMPCNPGMAAEYARIINHYPPDLVEKTLDYMIPNEVVRPGAAILKRYLDQAMDARREADQNKIKRESPENLDHCAKTPYGKRCLAILGMASNGKYGTPEFNQEVKNLIEDFPAYSFEWEAMLKDARAFIQKKEAEKISRKDVEMEWGLKSTGKTWRSGYNISEWTDKKPLRLFEKDTQKPAGEGK